MLPAVAAIGVAFWWLFGEKPKSKTGPTVLASMTEQFGTPIGTQNWPAASGRNYRVTHWVSGADAIVLALGGSWGNQPSAPNSLYAFKQTGDVKDTFVLLSGSLPDATATTDMAQLRASLGI
jgi:hypothetical protein